MLYVYIGKVSKYKIRSKFFLIFLWCLEYRQAIIKYLFSHIKTWALLVIITHEIKYILS